MFTRISKPWRGSTTTVVGFEGATEISNEELLAYDCDILIPAALECQIRTDNTDDIKAKLIVEAANGPVTAAADELLQEKKFLVLPDIAANSGGVVVSYFEWVQNLENQQWDIDKVERLLKKRMNRAVDNTVERWKALNETPKAGADGTQAAATLRDAALVTAIEKIATVVLQRVIWP